MDNERKNTISAVINLPVQSILTVIDNENPQVDAKIEKTIEKMKKDGNSIKSLNTRVFIDVEKSNAMGRTFDPRSVKLAHEDCIVTKIARKPIEKTNDIKFFNVHLEFSTGREIQFVLPSYVKFYSSKRNMFVPVEFVRNRDILLDYTGNIVKVDDTSLIENFKMSDFYNIHVLYNVIGNQQEDSMKILNEYNFYLNGVLTNISYNNFQKREE